MPSDAGVGEGEDLKLAARVIAGAQGGDRASRERGHDEPVAPAGAGPALLLDDPDVVVRPRGQDMEQRGRVHPGRQPAEDRARRLAGRPQWRELAPTSRRAGVFPGVEGLTASGQAEHLIGRMVLVEPGNQHRERFRRNERGPAEPSLAPAPRGSDPRLTIAVDTQQV